MNPNNPITAAAMQNALAGERTHLGVNFPTTGDPELDLACGCLQIYHALHLRLTSAQAARIFAYLHARLHACAKAEQESARQFEAQANPYPPSGLSSSSSPSNISASTLGDISTIGPVTLDELLSTFPAGKPTASRRSAKL